MFCSVLSICNNRYWAVVMLFITVCSWGGMYHVVKDALIVVDAYWLTVIRSSFAALFFIPLLIWREGREALRFTGYRFAIWWYGTLGFAVFNYLVFMGIGLSRPEHGAVIMATMPLISAIIIWLSGGARPATYTLIAIAIAFSGVLLVVTHGDIALLWQGHGFYGDLLVFIGAISWVLYTRSAPLFRGWSSLRFTTLTALTGAISSLLVTTILTFFGGASIPQLSQMPDVSWNIVYIVGLATIAGVIFWNQGIRVIGVINGMLFINLIPVSAYAISLNLGRVPNPIELVGVALILLALVANNLKTRSE